VYIDLNALGGEGLRSFKEGALGPIKDCPSGGEWEAFLVDPDPVHTAPLQMAESEFPGKVRIAPSSAPYTCEAKASAYVPGIADASGFGAPDGYIGEQQGAWRRVNVNTLNVNRILYENTIPSDWVMVKMDIEGTEWEVLPCLATSPAASLIDRLYLAVHAKPPGAEDISPFALAASVASLRQKGVDIPGV